MKMKKVIATVLSCAMVFSLAACGSGDGGSTGSTGSAATTATETAETQKADTGDEKQPEEAPAGGVELEVITTFAGNDGNAQNYKKFYQQWEAETGNKVVDMSATSDDTFKVRIVTDFETGSEPDVLFFFIGADANSFIEAGKVVSIEDIRAEYPDYASNMSDGRIPASLVDNKAYAVPVNGIWEAMFVNMEVLDAAGVAKPGADYTWEQFEADCQKIKDAGYTPIAAALGDIPHYWWEFAIFNHTTPENHLTIPESASDEIGQGWVAAMEDIKALYEAGYFPDNTLSAKDDETFAMFVDGKAAFLIDGSWKVNGIVSACQSDPDDASTLDAEKLSKFDVTYVPAKDSRKTTDLLGGLTMGYYITKKAWDDPAKRQAAVDFVSFMTSDDVVPVFAQHAASALKNAPEVDESVFNELQIKSLEMMAGCTSITGVVQDLFQGESRVPTFDGMPEIVTGKVSAVDAVQEGLDIYYSTN